MHKNEKHYTHKTIKTQLPSPSGYLLSSSRILAERICWAAPLPIVQEANHYHVERWWGRNKESWYPREPAYYAISCWLWRSCNKSSKRNPRQWACAKNAIPIEKHSRLWDMHVDNTSAIPCCGPAPKTQSQKNKIRLTNDYDLVEENALLTNRPA